MNIQAISQTFILHLEWKKVGAPYFHPSMLYLLEYYGCFQNIRILESKNLFWVNAKSDITSVLHLFPNLHWE